MKFSSLANTYKPLLFAILITAGLVAAAIGFITIIVVPVWFLADTKPDLFTLLIMFAVGFFLVYRVIISIRNAVRKRGSIGAWLRYGILPIMVSILKWTGFALLAYSSAASLALHYWVPALLSIGGAILIPIIPRPSSHPAQKMG